jgi:hypothetical protein
MKQALVFAGKAILSGLLIVVPLYLAVLVLLKAMKTVAALVRPSSLLLPEWFPAEKVEDGRYTVFIPSAPTPLLRAPSMFSIESAFIRSMSRSRRLSRSCPDGDWVPKTLISPCRD